MNTRTARFTLAVTLFAMGSFARADDDAPSLKIISLQNVSPDSHEVALARFKYVPSTTLTVALPRRNPGLRYKSSFEMPFDELTGLRVLAGPSAFMGPTDLDRTTRVSRSDRRASAGIGYSFHWAKANLCMGLEAPVAGGSGHNHGGGAKNLSSLAAPAGQMHAFMMGGHGGGGRGGGGLDSHLSPFGPSLMIALDYPL